MTITNQVESVFGENDSLAYTFLFSGNRLGQSYTEVEFNKRFFNKFNQPVCCTKNLLISALYFPISFCVVNSWFVRVSRYTN